MHYNKKSTELDFARKALDDKSEQYCVLKMCYIIIKYILES